MTENWQTQAEIFVRSHWAGGIGEPDVTAEDILDVVDSIFRIVSEAPPGQPCATLEWEEA